jgi:hypothetical protein
MDTDTDMDTDMDTDNDTDMETDMDTDMETDMDTDMDKDIQCNPRPPCGKYIWWNPLFLGGRKEENTSGGIYYVQ